MTFDATKPADAQDAYQVDDDIRDNFAGIQKGDHWTTGTEPTYKEEGCPWYDSTNDVFKIYNGTTWDSLIEDDSTSFYDYGSSASASTAKARSAIKICYGYVTVTGNQQISGLPFTSSTSYVVTATFVSTAGKATTPVITINAKDKFTIYEGVTGNPVIHWQAIGT